MAQKPFDLLVIVFVIKYSRQTKNKDRIKKSPADSLSVFIFFILDITHHPYHFVHTVNEHVII